MKMKKLVVLAVLILALSTSVAMAWTGNEVAGSAVVGSKNVTSNNATFELSTVFTINDLIYTSGTGDFAAVAPTINLLPNPVSLDITNLSAWTFNSATFGTWTTTGGTYQFIPATNSIFLVVALTGQFTPGTLLPGKIANTGVMNIAFTKTDGSESVSGTLGLEKRPVPEASTLVGFGSALAMAGPGLVGWLRRRRA